MKKLFYLLNGLLLTAALAACSSDYDDPPEQPNSHQNEVSVDSVDVIPTEGQDSTLRIPSSALYGKWQLISQPGLDLTNRIEILELTDSMFYYESVNSNLTAVGEFLMPEEWIMYNESLQSYEGEAYAIKTNKQTAKNDTLLYHVYFGQSTDTLKLFPDYAKGMTSVVSAWKTYCRMK
ncbi:MAG: hypothetical protein J5965_13510 [Aeriscardovia sp.]|nr:hypothetical protein [Aeriscardovia sp.]